TSIWSPTFTAELGFRFWPCRLTLPPWQAAVASLRYLKIRTAHNHLSTLIKETLNAYPIEFNAVVRPFSLPDALPTTMCSAGAAFASNSHNGKFHHCQPGPNNTCHRERGKR